ncbi:tetratricopeptide repeat protein [Micromonospora auratinigra]|uniref:tetratricopeptide repeat protein n=1 Tax=Micromonospora auratinigra TaxID=261654 RepID=UPI0012FE2037|nr:tetratricopeptide repeat protein [Micromonospora auratinigra]
MDDDAVEVRARAAVARHRYDPADRARQQIDVARRWRQQGDYRRAGLLLALTMPTVEEHCGRESLDVAQLCNEWAVVGKYAGDFDLSEKLYLRALAIFRHRYGACHNTVATVLHNLGGLAHARGAHAEGEPYAALSVRIRTSILGPGHPLVGADRAAWAALLVGCGRADEAEEQLLRALAIFRAHHGGRSYEVASALHNLAAVQHRRGRLEEAIDEYREALLLKRRLLGPRHPDLAVTLVNLAAALCRHGDLSAARHHFALARSILGPQVSPDHPTLVAAVQGIAGIEQAAASGRRVPPPAGGRPLLGGNE